MPEESAYDTLRIDIDARRIVQAIIQVPEGLAGEGADQMPEPPAKEA